jgi:hypothetical protein
MAWTSLASAGSGNSKTAGTALGLTTSRACAAGEVLVVAVAKDNVSTTDGNTSEVTSITDAGGNTYVKAREFTNGQAGAAAGATVSLWYAKLTTALSSGAAVTVNFSASITAKAASLWAFSAAAGSAVAVQTALDLANDAADPGSQAISGLASQEWLFVRAIASETNATTFTATASHTAIAAAATTGGAAATNIAVLGEFRILTGTADTSDPTATAVDNASVFVAFREVPGFTGTGAAALALGASASGARGAAGTATATLVLTAAAAGVVTAFGTGAATLVLGAAASGARGAAGTQAATLALGASASGGHGVSGAEAATLSLTAVATGARGASGTQAATLTLGVAASGARGAAGDGAATFALGASATGTITGALVTGTGAATLALDAAGTGTSTPPAIIGTGAAVLVLASDIIVRFGGIWDAVSPTPETWTPVGETGETWAPVPAVAKAWSAVAANDETWTPVPPAAETWSAV